MKNKKKIIIILIIAIIISLTLGIVLLNIGKEPEHKDFTIEPIDSITIPDSSSEINEENLETEGFQEENPELSGAVREQKHNEEELVTASSSTVYYSQIDSRWKNHPYTSIGDSSQTIGTSGCGPTSAAMVVSSIKGVVYPDTMGDLYVNNGFRSPHDGTYLSAFRWTANYYGIEYTQTSNLDIAVDLLRNNYLLVASCGEGLFTTGGHLIAIMGVDGNTLIIHDPYLYNGKFDIYGRSGKVTVSGNTVYCSIENFRNYANCSGFYAFKNDNTKPTPEPTPTPTPVPTPSTSEIRYVSTRAGLNVRSGPGTNYSIVDCLTYGTQITVYEDSNGWSRIGNGQYVASQYTSTTKPGQSTTKTGTVYNIRTSLNVRSGPGTQYRVVGSKYNGNTVTIYESSNGFYKIGTNQWVSSQYVRVSGNNPVQPAIVGTKQKLAKYTILYHNGDLSGTQYQYLANTTVKILSRNGNIDYVQVIQTGRKAYLYNVGAYK